MITTNKTERIEKYLDGRLDSVDRKEFEDVIKKDESLAQELKFQRELRETIKDEQKMKVRRTLSRVYRQTSYKSTFIKRWKLNAIAAAVTIMILTAGGMMFNYFQTSSTNNIALYNEYFDVDSELFTVRADKSTVNNTVEDGITAFNEKDFTKALELFNKSNDNMASNLYAGFTYMQLLEFDNAIQKFNEILDDNNNLFIDQAKFNLALCYIANNDLIKAETELQGIIDENSAYTPKAQKILNTIEK